MSRLLHLVLYGIRRWIDFTFRVRSLGMGLINAGIVLAGVALSGLALNIDLSTSTWALRLGINTNSDTAAFVTYAILALAVLLIGSGIFRIRVEIRSTERRRAIAIELRGLRDWTGASLLEAVPAAISGRRESVVLDVRQGVIDGEIVSPEAALAHFDALRPRVKSIETGLDRRDITFVAGGLAPVPFTFLLGVLLDDEGPITCLDWDRHLRTWRELDASDDGKRFAISGMEAASGRHPDVIVAISASYAVDLDGARAAISSAPVVRLDLIDASTEAHWSFDKQCELARQFLDVVVKLGNAGVSKVHLFFAGPSSLVLRFGMTYDKRNLPTLIVYQHDKGEDPPFPWGVAMPVAGRSTPAIVRLPKTR